MSFEDEEEEIEISGAPDAFSGEQFEHELMEWIIDDDKKGLDKQELKEKLV